MFELRKRVAAVFACVVSIAVFGACGDDDASTQPVEMGGSSAGTAGSGTGGMTVTAGRSGSPAGGASGSAGRGAMAGTGMTAGRGAAGRGVAGRTGGTAGEMEEDDAGVTAGTGGSGAGGSAGTAGAAGNVGSGAGGSNGGSGGTAGAAGSGTGTAATFTEVYAIFMQSCAGATCHVMATRPGEGLAMTDKMTAYMNLVGVNAGACSGEKRVVAGDPAKSELLHTLERTQVGNCRNTPRMPEGKPMLSADQIAKVRSWIQGGAMNN